MKTLEKLDFNSVISNYRIFKIKESSNVITELFYPHMRFYPSNAITCLKEDMKVDYFIKDFHDQELIKVGFDTMPDSNILEYITLVENQSQPSINHVGIINTSTPIGKIFYDRMQTINGDLKRYSIREKEYQDSLSKKLDKNDTKLILSYANGKDNPDYYIQVNWNNYIQNEIFLSIPEEDLLEVSEVKGYY